MIAVDTSSLIAFLRGETGRDVDAVDQALEFHQAVLPPAVLTELLSDPHLDRTVSRLIRALPVLESDAGFWERTGRLRAKLIAKRLRARIADSLIAQSCIDHRVPLIARDGDFRHFARYAGLALL